MPTIAFAHLKGGTGKTTSCINIAGCLVAKGFKVLAVDLDPQSSLTSGLGVDPATVQFGMGDVLLKKKEMREIVLETLTPHLHLAPAGLELGEIRAFPLLPSTLRSALLMIKGEYDYIVIDTPPADTGLIKNGITAADGVYLVLDTGIFAVEALMNVKRLFSLEQNTQFKGVILTKCELTLFGTPTHYVKDLQEAIEHGSNKPVFYVPFSKEILASQLQGLPLSTSAPSSKAAHAYEIITEQILQEVPHASS
ncbi:AAA family ATPase [Candidatus Woesearchaeota archaeon]|nr:AAA family ATPase [Candidatus Woesearchaeota archaeon]